MNRIVPHAAILALTFALVVPARVALSGRYKAERRTIEAEGRNQRVRELAAAWNALKYTDATSADFFDALVTKIDWSSLRLSEAQKTKLISRLREVFDYLRDPSFEEFYRLKTEGFRWEFQLTKLAGETLRRAGLVGAAHGEGEPRGVAKSVWDVVAHKSGGGTPARFTAACLDYVRITTSQTNSPASILSGRISKGHTVAQLAVDPGFKYVGAVNSSATKRAQDLFLHVSLFARSNASTNAAPVYISLYWSEADQSWALSHLLTDVLLKVDTLF